MADTSPPDVIGWPLLPLPDEHGRLTYPTPERSVRDAVQVILRTRPGEQLMRPDFGAGLENFLHAPNTVATRQSIHDQITSALQQWEPRIIVNRIDVTEVPDQPTQLRIEISYRLQRSGVPQRLAVSLRMEA